MANIIRVSFTYKGREYHGTLTAIPGAKWEPHISGQLRGTFLYWSEDGVMFVSDEWDKGVCEQLEFYIISWYG